MIDVIIMHEITSKCQAGRWPLRDFDHTAMSRGEWSFVGIWKRAIGCRINTVLHKMPWRVGWWRQDTLVFDTMQSSLDLIYSLYYQLGLCSHLYALVAIWAPTKVETLIVIHFISSYLLLPSFSFLYSLKRYNIWYDMNVYHAGLSGLTCPRSRYSSRHGLRHMDNDGHEFKTNLHMIRMS